jgi:glycosyltransferase involved in cell wall biosynthesis
MPDATTPRYSLVVMTYDRPEGLRGCLESIVRLDARETPFEVIVVDDGSAPPARPVVEAFAGRLPLAYEHGPNRGVAAARNRGLALARGERVAFLADDYRLPPDYLRRVEAFFAARPEAQVISFSVRPAARGWLAAVQALYHRLALAQQFAEAPDAEGVVAAHGLPASRAAVFRRTIFERVGRFDERLRVGEDGDFGRRLAEHGVPVHLFLRAFVDHAEAAGAGSYLRQRRRYGRSFVRVLGGGAARPALERFGPAGVTWCAAAKLREWWAVAGRLNERPRFVAHSPWLIVFLLAFYAGALRELRRPTEREG